MSWQALSEIEFAPIEWLWEPFVPRGEITAVMGRMDRGKSQFVNWLVARVTRAGGDVLMFSGEEDPRTTLGPRLVAAGAVTHRVAIAHAFDLDADAIREGYRERNVQLVTVDPFTHFLPERRDANSSQAVRRVLAGVIDLAHDPGGPAVVVTQHVNRDTETQDALDRIAGSQGLAQVARSVLVWGIDDGPRRLLARAKANLAPASAGMGARFEIKARDVGIAGKHPFVEYLGEADIEADELVASPAQRSTTDDAREWLVEYLGDREVPVKELDAAAKASGIGEYAWRAAKRRYTQHRRPGGTTGPWLISLVPPNGKDGKNGENVLTVLPVVTAKGRDDLDGSDRR